MMKVNRKTINSDINHIHDKLHYELYNIDLESTIMMPDSVIGGVDRFLLALDCVSEAFL